MFSVDLPRPLDPLRAGFFRRRNKATVQPIDAVLARARFNCVM